MTKIEFIEKYIDIPKESCDYIPLKKEMESDLNTLIETLLTEYQALKLQQTGVMRSNWIECKKCGLIKNRDKCVPCGCDK